MRYLVLACLVAGCHHSTPLQDDLATFCSPEAVKHAGAISDFGPWIEPQLKSPEMKETLAKLKNNSVSLLEWQHLLDAQLAEAKITSCPTYDAMFKAKPASGTPAPTP
jgi:hypothetical protein